MTRDDELLLQRARVGAGLLLAGTFAFVLSDAFDPAMTDLFRPYLALRSLLAAVLIAAIWAGPRVGTATQVKVLALAVLTATVLVSMAGSILGTGVLTTPIICLSLAFFSAVLLPWEPRYQIAFNLIATAAIAANFLAVPAELARTAYYPVFTMFLSLHASAYVCYELGRSRRATQREMSERRRAEEEARRSEARKTAIVEAAVDGIVTIDDKGVIIEVNLAAESMFHIPREEFLHRKLAETLIPAPLREAHRIAFERYLRTGRSHVLGRRIETTAMRADGSEFPVQLAIVRVPGTEPPLFTGYIHDLTEHRLAEEARLSTTLVHAGRAMMGLLDTGLLLERLAALSKEVLACDCSHSFLWNVATQAYVEHHPTGDAAGANAFRSDDIADTLNALRHEELIDGQDLGPLALHDADGPTLAVALGRGDQLFGFHVVCHRNGRPFNSLQKQAARGLAQIAAMALTNARLVEDLERANRVKSEFLSTMSHELRTPLAAILGYVEMIECDDPPADERNELLGRIKIAGHHLLELIDNTLEIGRMESGAVDLRLSRTHLPTLWQKIGQDCAHLPRANGVSLQWDADAPNVVLTTDPRKIAIILRNLVGNALKFTQAGHVRAEARASRDAVEITVSDTGVGIRPEDQRIIFEMFRQVDGSDSRRFGGSGLGLYIVKRFAEQLGGCVAVESEPGRGSTFKVALPREADGNA